MSLEKKIDASNSIGFLSGNNVNSWRSYKKYSETAKRLGLYLVHFSEPDFKRILDNNKQKIDGKYWDGKSVNELKLEIPLVYYDKIRTDDSEVKKNLELIEKKGFKFINSPRFRELCLDKWKSQGLLDLLSGENFRIPETRLYSKEALENFYNRNDLLFIKHRTSSQGKNQIVIKKRKNYTDLIDSNIPGQKKVKNLKNIVDFLKERDVDENYIIQQGIEVDRINDRAYDYRVIIQKNKSNKFQVTCIYARVGYLNSYHSNICKKGHPQDPKIMLGETEYRKLNKNLKETSLKIIDVFSNVLNISNLNNKEMKLKDCHCGEAGLDFVIDKYSNLYFIEINSKPGNSGLKTLCEWNPSEKKHFKTSPIPFSYSNEDREKWGEKLRLYYKNPLDYGRFLINLVQKKDVRSS